MTGPEATWQDLILTAVLVGSVPILVGGPILLSVIGLTVWVSRRVRSRNGPSSQSPASRREPMNSSRQSAISRTVQSVSSRSWSQK